MRIETSGNYSWRADLYDDVAEALDEGTRSGGLDAAAELVLELLGKPGSSAPGALEDVAALLEDDRVPDDVAGEIAAALSNDELDVRVEYRPAASRLDPPGDDG